MDLSKRIVIKGIPTVIIIVFSTLGFAAMLYLFLSFGVKVSIPNVCSINAVINCAKVDNSAYSKFAGISLYDYGMAYFALTLLLAAALRLTHRKKNKKYLEYSLLSLSIFGAIAVVYLVYAEIFSIKAICEMCTISHASIIAILASSVYMVKKRFER